MARENLLKWKRAHWHGCVRSFYLLWPLGRLKRGIWDFLALDTYFIEQTRNAAYNAAMGQYSMDELKVEYVDIDSIKPYEGNAKQHPQEQIEQIKESIEELGFRDPLGVWKGIVMVGNGRYTAAKELGMKKVPIVRLDDMTDDQRKAYALIHNKLTMNSGFDFDALEAELDALSDSDISMADFGFEDEDIPDIDGMFGESAPKEDDSKNETHMIKCPHCGEIIEVDSNFNVVM